MRITEVQDAFLANNIGFVVTWKGHAQQPNCDYLVLNDEEVEAVQEILGPKTVLSGFYSNGEICPGYHLEACSLHNQTMTITYLAEAGEY